MNKALFFTLFISISLCYTEIIQGKSESCYEIEVKSADAELGVTWSVFDGGLKDIGVKITGPNGVVYHDELYFEDKEMNYSKDIKATPGVYFICFDNTHSKYTPKKIFFDFDVRDNSLRKEELKENKERLESIDNTLSDIIILTNNYRVRETKSRKTAEKTCVKVQIFSIFSSILIAATFFVQTMFLRSWFNRKRKY